MYVPTQLNCTTNQKRLGNNKKKKLARKERQKLDNGFHNI